MLWRLIMLMIMIPFLVEGKGYMIDHDHYCDHGYIVTITIIDDIDNGDVDNDDIDVMMILIF